MFRKTNPNKKSKREDNNATWYIQSLGYIQRIQFHSTENNPHLKHINTFISLKSYICLEFGGGGREVWVNLNIKNFDSYFKG